MTEKIAEDSAVEESLSSEAIEIISKIEAMSVLELSKLVKSLEDKFGVVAAAPVAVAGSVAGTANESESDDAGSDTLSVVLTSVGDKKIQVLKAVREITGLGLKEAKEIVDSAPKEIKSDLDKEEAEKIKKLLEEQGASVELK